MVSSFVFQDGLTETRGIAVVMTPSTIQAVLSLVDDIKPQSPALQRPPVAKLHGPDAYVLDDEPVHAHSVSIVIAEDSEVVVVGFRCVDLTKTLADNAEQARVRVQTTMASQVALGVPSFLAWIDALAEKRSARGDDER